MFDARKNELITNADDPIYMRGVIGQLEEHDLHLIKAKFRFLNIPGVGKTLVELFHDSESDREWPGPIQGVHPERVPPHGSVAWRELAEDYAEFDYDKLCTVIRQEWEAVFTPVLQQPVLELQDFGFTLEEWNETYADTVWDECVPQNWN